MLFNYKAIDTTGEKNEGTIDAISLDVAINAIQKRNLVLSSISPVDDNKSFKSKIKFLNRVSNKDVVILSRQMATLFDAQVSALQIFKLLASEMTSPVLRKALTEVADDLQGGSTISKALSKHGDIFSGFYVNMVRAGEESGKLNDTFNYLADYLDRTYEVTSKARNALIYPAFVIMTFIGVMVLMFTIVIPKISVILVESGQEIPFYTKIVLGISTFFLNYGLFLLIAVIVGGFFLIRFINTPQGSLSFSAFKLGVPYVGDLYRKLYLSRIADNMSTMISSGISMVRSIEITSAVVGNDIYQRILEDALQGVKGGSSFSGALSQYKEIPTIMTTMIKVGEETGELGTIMNTMAKFYRREVTNAVDTLVDLIEPVMIVTLGVGVGVLLAAVLMPIYNVAGSIS
ncbi:MAG: hypothetical protein RJA61_632 [Candidatus Parcubacteria bacterium]|jgi:type IV pilus assembly protein PilC